MKRILLEGILGDKFGREWFLEVKSPAESIRAIATNKKDFFKYLLGSAKDGIAYRIMLDELDIEPERLVGPFSDKETFRVVPVIAGSEGEGKAIVGIILIIAAIILAVPTGGGSLAWSTAIYSGSSITAGMVGVVGVSLVISGISASMMQMDTTSKADKNTESYSFGGPVNTVAQGGPVPVGYGRLRVGSTIISGGINTQEIAIE